MKKRKFSKWSLIIVVFLAFACTQERPFVIDPPIPGLETQFIEITVDPLKDSTYVLENSTEITIPKESLLSSEGSIIQEPVKLMFRQFDDAVSIFLSGLPMSFGNNNNAALQTAGMYEIRGDYNGQSIEINPDKPISIQVGSFFDDPRMGFFKLNEETGEWNLVDIPEAKYNEEVTNLKDKVATLKPEWELPLNNFYVFSLYDMADIFLGNDWEKIRNANMDAMANKMKTYGVDGLDVYSHYLRVYYKGNYYEAGEMLWKAEEPLHVPEWAKVYPLFDDFIQLNKKSGNIYTLKIKGAEDHQRWSADIELISHLRYLIRYTPEQLLAKQEAIEKEINEAEEKLKNLRIIEYTADIYQMGIYNCDKPIYFQNGKPQLTLKFDGKVINSKEIHKVSVFNEDLSSYSFPFSYDPLTCTFFKGTNKILLITKDGDIGLYTGSDFNQINTDQINQSLPIEINLTSIKVANEEELREHLRN